jgi:spore coat protein A, manganese oxidase
MGAKLTRRRLLAGAGAAAALAVAPSWLRGPGMTGELLRSAAPLPPRFATPLPIPPVLSGETIELTARRGELEILPGHPAAVDGFDGRFPGPTIESRRGRPVIVRHRNALDHPISVHLHGGRTPAAHDGFPTDLVRPGEVREYRYPLDQRGATLWYHDHVMDRTAVHLYRGLAGFHIVRDDEEDALPLPGGDRELPLMLADRSLGEDGELVYPHDREFVEGVLGDVMLVNGAPWPVHDVATARYRLRLLNASNARRYTLALEPGLPFVQVGTDGGLLERPRTLDRLTLAPAERADVVVDFGRLRPGDDVTLVDRLGAGPMLRFRVARRVRDESAVPDRLSTVERLDPGDAEVTRELRFARGGPGWVIDGRPFDPERIDLRPQLGATERWRVSSDLHHPVHIHLVHFQVQGEELAWKDTVDLRPGQTAELLMRFDGYPGRYVLHCHNLEHEDMAMMAAFEVVAPGQAAAISPSSHSRASSRFICRLPQRTASA